MIDSIYLLLHERGVQLLAGASIILALASLLVLLCKAPIHRQRLAELSLAALSVWLVAVLLPMPRLWNWQDSSPLITDSREAYPPAAEPLMPELNPAQLAMLAEMDALQAYRDRLPPEPRPEYPLAKTVPAETEGTLVYLPPRAERFEIDLGSWLISGYLGGGALVLFYLAMGAGLLCLHICRCQQADSRIRILGRRLMREGGVNMPLRILLSNRSCRPYCLGLRRASIVLPAALAEPGKAAQLAEVLRHEIGHLRQGDYRGQLLFAAALPLLFFHPLFWFLRREARLSAELIADDWAARQSDRAQYARELIALSATNHSGPAGLLPAMPVIASKNQFYRRMTMLLQRDDDLATSCTPLRRRLQLSLAGLFVATAASLWGVEPLSAQEPGKSSVRKLRVENDRLASRVADLQSQLAVLEDRLAQVLAMDPRPAKFPPGLIGIGEGAGGKPGRVPPPPMLNEDLLRAHDLLRDLPMSVRTLDAHELDIILRAVAAQRGDEKASKRDMRDAWREQIAEMAAVEEVEAVDEVEEVEEVEVSEEVNEEIEEPEEVENPEEPSVLSDLIGVRARDLQSAVRNLNGRSPQLPGFAPEARAYEDQVLANSAVLDLVTRHIDLVSDLRQAEIHISETSALAERSMVSKSELRAAEISLDATQQKLDALRRVMDVEVSAAKLGINSLAQRMEKARELGNSTAEFEAGIMRLEARIDILRSVH